MTALSISTPPLLEGELLPPVESLAGPDPRPIVTAPIVAGEELDRLLLWPGPQRYPPHWVIGRWTGREWAEEGGFLFAPTHWSPLPTAPE